MDNQVAEDVSIVMNSTNYGKFKLMSTNREIYQRHVEVLKQAFETIGNLTKVQPILVNENYEIIDGQHHFMACKELHQPIYFTMVPGLGVTESRSMNVLQRAWNIDDWARSYAATGLADYVKYLALKEDYGFSHSTMLNCIYGADIRGKYKAFREGEFTIPDIEAAVERLNLFAEIAEVVPQLKSDKYFVRAILNVAGAEGFDLGRMLRKLANAGSLLKKYATTADYLRMLEEIYNYKITERNRVRLY